MKRQNLFLNLPIFIIIKILIIISLHEYLLQFILMIYRDEILGGGIINFYLRSKLL